MADKKYKHFHLNTDEDNILWVSIDRKNASVNSLNREVFNELDALVTQIAADEPAGVVFFSGKEKGFIAGADITQFTALKTKKEAFDLVRLAQVILDKLEALKMPTVAMIKGFCLGGGLEFALACRYRVADEDSTTRIGLPEIKLGIHPGWGGTVRLPRLIGVPAAMKMILPGAAYPAKKAEKVGIVDATVPLRELKRAAKYYVTHQPKPHEPTALAALSNTDVIRPWLGKIFYKNLTAKRINKEHYPAPYAVIDNWIRDGAKGNEAMINEANSIAELMMTDTSRNLVRVFFLQEKLKGLAKDVDFKPTHVHVMGAGTMGGDIAAWCAYKGFHVTLQDTSAEHIAPAIKRAHILFKEKLRESRLIQAAMDRLLPDVEGSGVARADFIIEAIFEDLSAKQKLFQALESKAKSEAIFATNTSSIPLEEIGAVLKKPARLVGVHFFNPVAKMMLVEVVHGKNTAEDAVKKAQAFVARISRLPLPVASRPGFLINRILMPYLLEAMQLYEEGISPEEIDRIAMEFGMPMGPITLADTVGLDICLSVGENLTNHFGGKIPEKLTQMVKEGYLGVKSGKGFYEYKNGIKIKTIEKKEMTIPMTDLCDRMVLRMINEAVACLQEKIISGAELLDAGMIFGTSFAPFRGGPIQYAKTRGITDIVKRLKELTQKYGERFKPYVGWEKIAEKTTVKERGDGPTRKKEMKSIESAETAMSKSLKETDNKSRLSDRDVR